MTDRDYLDAWSKIAALCEAALIAGDETVALEFSPLLWIAIIDEIKDRRPRNFSRLLADDTLLRLDEAIFDLGRVAYFLSQPRGAPK